MNITNNPETNKLFAELAACGAEDTIFNDCIESTLGLDAEHYGDNRSDRTEIAAIAKRLHSEEAPTAHQLEKAERAKRAEQYRKQYEQQRADGVDADDCKILDWDADERLLNNKQLAFCGYAVRAGFMDQDWSEE